MTGTPNTSEGPIYFVESGNFDLPASCICAVDPNCQIQLGIYDYNEDTSGNSVTYDYYTLAYSIPGSVAGCFIMDSLFSTLECFYSDSNCWRSLISRIMNMTLLDAHSEALLKNIEPLVYDPESTRFPRNSSILSIVKELMIEQWYSSMSYDSYYQACAPIYCTYSAVVNTETAGGVALRLVSTVGGLTVILRLISPQLVQITCRLFGSRVRNEEQGNLEIVSKKQTRRGSQLISQMPLRKYHPQNIPSRKNV